MFTGLVIETGKVIAFEEGAEAWRLKLTANKVLDGLEMGDSIACNGCCLTAVAFSEDTIEFDLLAESVRLTSFAALKQGASVNMETSLCFNGKLGGHFVTGHVDCTGEVLLFEERGQDYYLKIKVPEQFMKYLVYKGSITIDGISLTVAEVDDAQQAFAVWLIPHTLEVTNLDERKPGDPVNLEFDLLGKYVERLLPVK